MNSNCLKYYLISKSEVISLSFYSLIIKNQGETDLVIDSSIVVKSGETFSPVFSGKVIQQNFSFRFSGEGDSDVIIITEERK